MLICGFEKFENFFVRIDILERLFIKIIENIKRKISSKISFNESMSKLSWFNLGGPAKILFRPQNLQELSIFLKEIKGINKIKVLGAGSNTLIRDGGFDGIIIKIGKKAFYKQLEMPLKKAYNYTSEVMTENMMALDAKEGISAFLDKRNPQWKNK